MSINEIIISKLYSASGKEYGLNRLLLGEYQYMDRQYQFNYIPKKLNGCIHLKTNGNDKLISENDTCLSFEVNCNIDIFILYADKFPLLPEWLVQYERTRLNVTRQDSRADNLKGYFGLYRKTFQKGLVKIFGCSPNKMLAEDWYKNSGGANYCMYTVAILRKD